MLSHRREENRLRRQTEVFTVFCVNASACLYNIQEDITGGKASQIVLSVCSGFTCLPEISQVSQQLRIFGLFCLVLFLLCGSLAFSVQLVFSVFQSSLFLELGICKVYFEKICLNPNNLKACASNAFCGLNLLLLIKKYLQ